MVEQVINHSKHYFRNLLNRSGWPGSVATNPLIICLLAIVMLLALIDPPQITESILFTLEAFWEMLPFLLLAIGFAASTKATGADKLIAKAFSGSPVRSIVLAALVGAISPFCSCGVIPLIAGLLGAGVPLAPVMAFWIASPIMDPEMFIITAAGIGFDFAVAKTFAAIAMGLMAGFFVMLVQRFGFLGQPLRASVSNSCTSSCDASGDTGVIWKFWQEPQRNLVFQSEVKSIGVFLGKWLAFAFFLESLMIAYISPDWITAYVGADDFFAIPLAAIIGVPSYLNGYAAVPLISGLLEMGMSPGAAMAFITAGAVSSIPAAIAVFALVKRPVFVLYLLIGLSGAMMTAWLYQFSGASI